MLWTEEMIIKFVENEGYEFIEFIRFNRTKSRIKIWCKNPNHKPYEVTFNSFKSGSRCIKCKGEERVLWDEKDMVNYIEKEGYKLIKFITLNGVNSKIEIWCGEENHSHRKMSFHNFQQGRRCVNCRGYLTHQDVKEYIESFGYRLLSEEYENNRQMLLIQCDKGHNPYEVNFNNFKDNESRCPYCNNSKGEDVIKNFLTDKKINFISQYKFEDCRGKSRPLPFDFYLTDYNICIEYDGKQHFKYGCFNMDLLDLMNRKYCDDYKTKYCEDNNILLIRISYWEKDKIENILNSLI